MTTLTPETSSPRGLKALPRGIRFVVIGAVLVSAVFQARKGVLELVPGLGADSEVAVMSRKASEASRQLVTQFTDVHRSGNAPRETDAIVAPLLASVFNVGILKAKTKLAKADLESLASWSLATTQVGALYLFAGTGVVNPDKAPDDPKLTQQVNNNVVIYAPEIGRYLDAGLIINGKLSEIVANEFSAQTNEDPKRKEARAKVQFGVASGIYGVIDTFNIKSVSDEWRRGRLQALDYAVPKAARMITADQCREIRDLVDSTAGAMQDLTVKRRLESVGTALKC